MTSTEWKSFLHDYNSELLECGRITQHLPEEVIRLGWLGFPAATLEEVAAKTK